MCPLVTNFKWDILSYLNEWFFQSLYSPKGKFGLFEVGLYEVLIHSLCITYSRWRSARPQFGEAERSTSTEAKQCTAVARVSSKTCFSHKQYQFSVHHIFRIFSLFSLPSDRLFLRESAVIKAKYCSLSTAKVRHFTSQNTGAAGLTPPRSVT